MATCRQVITDALRKTAAKVTEGNPAPEPFDAVNALDALSSLYEETISRGLYGRLTDVLTEDDPYEAGENERITNNTDADIVITLPATITDDGDERIPRDLSVVVVAAETPQLYVYEANRAAWVDAYGLTLDSYAPLSSKGRHGLACWLAVRLIEEFGGQVGPATAREASRFHGTISGKFDSERTNAEASYF